MSLGLKVNLNRPQLQKMERILGGVKGQVVDNKSRLHQRFAVVTLQWIDRQFLSGGGQGGARWKPLTPNTIAGRRKASSKPLLDTGQLRQSFTAKVSARSVRVGTEKIYAATHEYGDTRTIKPKNAKILAFPVDSGFAGPKGKVRRSFSSLTTRKTYKRGQLLGFAKEVTVTIPPRPMLPKSNQILPNLISAGQRLIAQILKRSGSG